MQGRRLCTQGAVLPVVLLLAAFWLGPVVTAQAPDPHAGHHPPTPDADAHTMTMASGREASGTSWLPDNTPVQGLMWHSGPWMLMLHGRAFVQHVGVGSDRGSNQTGSINWLMGMASRPVGAGRITARIMTSLEPMTVGRCGYPDLVQSGESCRGVPLHDRQHPHDVFMELAAQYVRPLSDDLSLELYGGPAGEPALGPVAYPHRPSAAPQPLAPVTHHWLDATHVTFGVVTAGLAHRQWKVEGSFFNGREPDDDRYGMDVGALDSVAGRVWWLPSPQWALQVSTAQLRDAHHGDDVRRTTASLTYHRGIDGRMWASTAAWGINREHDASRHALLVESALDLSSADSVSVRAEVVGKSAADLSLPGDPHDSFTLTKIQGTYTRWWTVVPDLKTGAGAGLGVARLPASLEPVYGTRAPLEWSVFLTLSPGR